MKKRKLKTVLRQADDKTLEQIAVEENYSYKHVQRIHGYALEVFRRKFLDK